MELCKKHCFGNLEISCTDSRRRLRSIFGFFPSTNRNQLVFFLVLVQLVQLVQSEWNDLGVAWQVIFKSITMSNVIKSFFFNYLP